MRPSSSCTARPKSAARSVREPLGATPVRQPGPAALAALDDAALGQLRVRGDDGAPADLREGRERALGRQARAVLELLAVHGLLDRVGEGEVAGAAARLPTCHQVQEMLGGQRLAHGLALVGTKGMGKDATHEPFTQHLVAEARPGGTHRQPGRRPSPSVARTPTTRRRWPAGGPRLPPAAVRRRASSPRSPARSGPRPRSTAPGSSPTRSAPAASSRSPSRSARATSASPRSAPPAARSAGRAPPRRQPKAAVAA